MKKNQFKLSKLTEIAVLPRPIERQKVFHNLKMFCEETVTAMKTHPLNETRETVTFIKGLKFWKIVSIKDIYGSVKTRNDRNLTFLVNFGSVAKHMKQRKRIKSFTRDTSMAIEQCNSLIDVCRPT